MLKSTRGVGEIIQHERVHCEYSLESYYEAIQDKMWSAAHVKRKQVPFVSGIHT